MLFNQKSSRSIVHFKGTRGTIFGIYFTFVLFLIVINKSYLKHINQTNLYIKSIKYFQILQPNLIDPQDVCILTMESD